MFPSSKDVIRTSLFIITSQNKEQPRTQGLSPRRQGRKRRETLGTRLNKAGSNKRPDAIVL